MYVLQLFGCKSATTFGTILQPISNCGVLLQQFIFPDCALSIHYFLLGAQKWSSITWSFWHFWQYNWPFLWMEWVYVLVVIHNVVQMAKTLVDHYALPVHVWANFSEICECLPWWAWAWALQQFSELSTQIPMSLVLQKEFRFRLNHYRLTFLLKLLETIKTIILSIENF